MHSESRSVEELAAKIFDVSLEHITQAPLYCGDGIDGACRRGDCKILAAVEHLRAHQDVLVALKQERDALLAVVLAMDYCEGGRGAFSCHPPHDCRCPKSRADSPEKWKGEWVCVCGREELDRALAHPFVQAKLKEAPDAR